MYRYGIRFFVALLTFAIGLLVSAVPNLFHRAPMVYPLVYVRGPGSSCHHRRMGYVPSPVMSIETQPNEPLKILYLSTSLDPADSNKRELDFLVENKSDRDIKGFSISYRSGWTSNTKGGGGGISVIPNSELLRTGESHVVRINCDADQVLTVWLNSAEFADGSQWNNDREFTLVR